MRKALMICILAISITLMVNVKAYADEEPTATPTEFPTPTPEINDYYKLPLVRSNSFNINTMIRYYNEVLTSEQQKIARFLIGSYNFMYLTSRGFSYEDVNIFDDYVLKFDELAELIFNADSASNASRWSSTFQIYIASIITYAGNVNSTFNDWVENEARTLIIPYTTDALNAWTLFYNDPSNEGVQDFGAEAREWNIGVEYSFAAENWTMGSWPQERYMDMMLNYSPIMWTNVENNHQFAVSFKDVPLCDTIYVLRGVNGFSSYRFGFYNGSFQGYTMYTNEFGVYGNNDVTAGSLSTLISYDFSIINLNYTTNIQGIISEALYKTPFSYNYPYPFHNWYIGITHIVLVDNLQTLANRQDVLNDFSLGLITDYDWIKQPKDNMPYWWKPIDFEVEIESPEGNLDPASDDDFNQNIVNNTVINNFDIIAPGVQINVPVNWFDSEGNYLDYTYNYSIPFFAFIGDFFLTLGEIRVFILGGIILLLVGGVIGKFLL